MLFLLYINDLPKYAESVPRLFSDDTCLLVGEQRVQKLEKKLNLKLTKIHNWMVANKLTSNTFKSHALVISPKLRSSSVSFDLQRTAVIVKQ